MKLEIKHLAAYLPYELKVSNNTSSNDVNLVTGLRNETYFIEQNIKYAYGDIGNCKPLLRPLSDLTKEIEINGERFVPIVRLFNAENQNFTFRFDVKGLIKHMKRTILFATSEDDGVEEEVGYLSHNYKNMFYSQFEKLIEWHFDVFGLIDQGLALPLI